MPILHRTASHFASRTIAPHGSSPRPRELDPLHVGEIGFPGSLSMRTWSMRVSRCLFSIWWVWPGSCTKSVIGEEKCRSSAAHEVDDRGSKSRAERRKENDSPQHIVQLQHIILPRLDKVLHAKVLTELLAPRDIVYMVKGSQLMRNSFPDSCLRPQIISTMTPETVRRTHGARQSPRLS